jgi:hypothetical protein
MDLPDAIHFDEVSAKCRCMVTPNDFRYLPFLPAKDTLSSQTGQMK